jgi:hypothetical protein
MTEPETAGVGEEMMPQVRLRGARPPRLAAAPAVPPVQFASAPVQEVVVLPTPINLTFYQGDDFYLDLTVTDPNNNPVDCTNAQPISQIRPAPDDPNTLANLTVTVDATTHNLLHLHVAAADSAMLPLNSAWDIQLSSPSITTIAAGTVTCNPQVTQ